MKNSLLTLTYATAASALLLAACGETTGDRALSGAGIGAGVGAVGSALVGGNPLTGAAIGAAAGGVTGAATKSKDVNFGKPAWR